jgi:hypothetical protein
LLVRETPPALIGTTLLAQHPILFTQVSDNQLLALTKTAPP